MSAAGPVADRPWMPGYGIATGVEGLLPWSWAVERLNLSRHYWVATSNAAGVPHLAAVWAVWDADALCFSTGAQSRKARDLATNPRCSITPAGAAESVVVEGRALRLDAEATARVREPYLAKYGLPFPDGDPVFAVRPSTVVAVIDGDPDFTERATRWRFDHDPYSG